MLSFVLSCSNNLILDIWGLQLCFLLFWDHYCALWKGQANIYAFPTFEQENSKIKDPLRGSKLAEKGISMQTTCAMVAKY